MKNVLCSQAPSQLCHNTRPEQCMMVVHVHGSQSRGPATFGYYGCGDIASFPGLLTPAFVTCSTNTLVLQVTNAGVSRAGSGTRLYSGGTDKFTISISASEAVVKDVPVPHSLVPRPAQLLVTRDEKLGGSWERG